MTDTKDLLLAKLNETGDRPEGVACAYRSSDGTKYQSTLQELPAGTLESLFARSDKYLYVQRTNECIDAWDILIVHCLT